MSRCVACSSVMSGAELVRTKPDDTPEDICTKCLIAAGVYGGVEEAEANDAEDELCQTL